MNTNTPQARISTIELISYLLGMLILLLLATVVANGQSQTEPVKAVKAHAQVQQQPYREYRGVRLGMTAVEVRSKLGEPAFKSDEQDLYSFSANETAQIAYDTTKKVVTISTDYTGVAGAPDYTTVVGEGLLLQRPDGSLFRMVVFNSAGFWVSYNKSASELPVISVTIGTLR